MTTNHHTPISNGSAANASTINNPLSELDAELTAQDVRIGAVEADMPVLSGAPTEYYDGQGNFTVPAGTGASIDGHVIQSEGVDLTQRANVNFVGAGVRATNETGSTQVAVAALPYNYLINGGFDIAQRLSAPSTLTTIVDKGFGADRWQQFAENASWQYQRNDALGESGLTSQYYGTFKKITNAGKGIFVQKIEGRNSVPLRGKTVTFQLAMKASSSKTIRIAVLELQSGGTIDAFPAALASAFRANTVDPTWGANVAVITAASSKSITTSWQTISVTVAVPSNSKNIVCAFWTDSQFSVNDTLSVAEAGLYVAPSAQPWSPRLPADDFAQALRYAELVSYASGQFINSTTFGAAMSWKVAKRSDPTLELLTAAASITEIGVGSRTASSGTMVSTQSNIMGARCELTGFSGADAQSMGVFIYAVGGVIFASSEL